MVTLRHREPWRRGWRLRLGVGLLVILLIGLGVLWWQAPQLYDNSNIGAGDQAAATATTRAGILAVFAATIAAIGAIVALTETRRANLASDQRERYSTAISQLGDNNLDVRLGGIYGLHRIAEDSPRDLRNIIEVLCAFVRGHGRGPDDDSEKSWEKHRPPTDVQAALTVIAAVHEPERGSRIDLEDAHLEGAMLRGANLKGANLRGSWLTGASLDGANLDGANLYLANLYLVGLNRASLNRASLNRASLNRADLDGATLEGANLEGANLEGASLSGASLSGASLYGASLYGANLNRANLQQLQLNSAFGDEMTLLPDGLTPPRRRNAGFSAADADSASESPDGESA